MPQMRTDPARSSPTASASRVSSSLATRSPTAARQSSTELSGLAGLNTSDESRSKPVAEKAVSTQNHWRRLFGTFQINLRRFFTSTYRMWFHSPVVSRPPWFQLWSTSVFLGRIWNLHIKIRKKKDKMKDWYQWLSSLKSNAPWY